MKKRKLFQIFNSTRKKRPVSGHFIRFWVEIGENPHCRCSSCGVIGKVLEINYPMTMFPLQDPTQRSTTNYMEYWLCKSCYNKLSQAILNPERKRMVAYD